MCLGILKGANAVTKGICPKVNVIARLEYEITYYDSAVHRFSHYTTRTSPPVLKSFVSDVERSMYIQ